MPSHNLHVKWCKQILGFARPEVDKFLDEFVKEVDIDLLKKCIEECRDELLKHDVSELEEAITFYEDKLGVEPSRYTYGLMFYTYLDVDTQVKLARMKLRGHDSWRFFDPCIVLRYVKAKFGIEGVKVTIIHIVLDEVARLVKIDYTDARRGVETICNLMYDLCDDSTREVLDKIRHVVDDMIVDVAFSMGINLRSRKVQELDLLVTSETQLDKTPLQTLHTLLPFLKVRRLQDLSYDEAERLHDELKQFEKKFHVKIPVLFNKLTGTLHIRDGDMILLVKYASGHLVVYPHIVRIYPVGETLIKIEDFVRDVARFSK